ARVLARSAPSRHNTPNELEREDRCADDQRPFDEDVIAPVFWERRVGFGHRAISQVVVGSPVAGSLPSLIAIPIVASSSRIRSDSLKSFRARAAVRAAIAATIVSCFSCAPESAFS